MFSENRIQSNGMFLNFTCCNNKYKTDIERGYAHGNGYARGSVTKEPICKNDGFTSWLEYVVHTTNANDKCYWIMWYDRKGNPIISMSGVFNREEIINAFEEESLNG